MAYFHTRLKHHEDITPKHLITDDAYTYAMTSWRKPETEKLWNILRKVDWETLKKMREFA